MEKVLNFQLSLFGSFTNIQPNMDITMKINESLQGENFVPGTVEVNLLDATAKKMVTETRLQMVSQTKTWTIVFLADRIDINYLYYGGDEYFSTIEEVCKKAVDICVKAFAPIASTTGTRLAFNGQFLLNKMDEQKRQLFIKRFVTQPKIYGDNLLEEFNVQFNSLKNIHTSKNDIEKCNFIIGIGDILGTDTRTRETSRRTSVTIDINTSPNNTEFKYTYHNLLYLTNDALSLAEAALKEIEGV